MSMPVMGIVGMLVIANWSYGLIRDTGGIRQEHPLQLQLSIRARAGVLCLKITSNSLEITAKGS